MTNDEMNAKAHAFAGRLITADDAAAMNPDLATSLKDKAFGEAKLLIMQLVGDPTAAVDPTPPSGVAGA